MFGGKSLRSLRCFVVIHFRGNYLRVDGAIRKAVAVLQRFTKLVYHVAPTKGCDIARSSLFRKLKKKLTGNLKHYQIFPTRRGFIIDLC